MNICKQSQREGKLSNFSPSGVRDTHRRPLWAVEQMYIMIGSEESRLEVKGRNLKSRVSSARTGAETQLPSSASFDCLPSARSLSVYGADLYHSALLFGWYSLGVYSYDLLLLPNSTGQSLSEQYTEAACATLSRPLPWNRDYAGLGETQM